MQYWLNGCKLQWRKVHHQNCTFESSDIDASFNNLLFIYWRHFMLFIASICTRPPLQNSTLRGKGGDMRNETLSIVSINSCPLISKALLFNRPSGRRNFSRLSVISGWVVFPVQLELWRENEGTGQKVMEAEEGIQTSSPSSLFTNKLPKTFKKSTHTSYLASTLVTNMTCGNWLH